MTKAVGSGSRRNQHQEYRPVPKQSPKNVKKKDKLDFGPSERQLNTERSKDIHTPGGSFIGSVPDPFGESAPSSAETSPQIVGLPVPLHFPNPLYITQQETLNMMFPTEGLPFTHPILINSNKVHIWTNSLVKLDGRSYPPTQFSIWKTEHATRGWKYGRRTTLIIP